MIVHYLHLEGTAALPSKDQAPLVIDPDRVESGPVAFEEFQSIPRRRPKIAEFGCVVQVQQFAARDSAQFRWKRSRRPGSLVVEQVLCKCVSEAFDHLLILSEFDNLSMSLQPWMPVCLDGDGLSVETQPTRGSVLRQKPARTTSSCVGSGLVIGNRIHSRHCKRHFALIRLNFGVRHRCDLTQY